MRFAPLACSVAALAGTSPFVPAFAATASAQSASTSPTGLVAPSTEPVDAPAAADTSNAWETAPATRRYGFTAGILAGAMFGTAHGYPNAYGKIDNPDFYASATGVGSGAILWIGGALTDWFTFGLGGGGGSYGGSNRSAGGAFLFHLEAFPLFARGGAWRDLGVSADFGTGGGTITNRSSGAELSTAGSFSIASVGLFWESWRFASGHLVAGPAATFTYEGSESQVRTFGMAGIRGAFYGGP